MELDIGDTVCLFLLYLVSSPNYCSQAQSSVSKNIFDNLPDLAHTSSVEQDELDRYLSAEVEDVKDGLMWWFERRNTFPRLSRMACNYLSIPGKF